MSPDQADKLYSISSRFLFDPKLNSTRRTLLELAYNTTYTNFYSCVLSAWTSLISQLKKRHREIHFSLNENFYTLNPVPISDKISLLDISNILKDRLRRFNTIRHACHLILDIYQNDTSSVQFKFHTGEYSPDIYQLARTLYCTDYSHTEAFE